MRLFLTALRSRFLNNICYAATGEWSTASLLTMPSVLTLAFSTVLLRLLPHAGPRSRARVERQAQSSIRAVLRA